MPVGNGVIADSAQIYSQKKQTNSARVRLGLQRIREALVNNAKVASSQESALPKDWRNRVFR